MWVCVGWNIMAYPDNQHHIDIDLGQRIFPFHRKAAYTQGYYTYGHSNHYWIPNHGRGKRGKGQIHVSDFHMSSKCLPPRNKIKTNKIKVRTRHKYNSLVRRGLSKHLFRKGVHTIYHYMLDLAILLNC
jgi:hypothetical protein